MEGEGKKEKVDKFDQRRKKATPKTRLINQEIYNDIDWNGLKVEYEWAKRDVVVDVPFPVVRRASSMIPVWNLKRYEFLLNDKRPDTVNPKLWEQGKLNLNAGIFKVTDKIYQVRGYDLANMSLIRGDTGWIVIGCLTSQETAEAALSLVNAHFGSIPVSAIIISHSHVDHYGGVLGVLSFAAKENIKVYVPKGFTDDVIEENVNAGVAMCRRGMYMYGELLPRDKKGQIDCK